MGNVKEVGTVTFNEATGVYNLILQGDAVTHPVSMMDCTSDVIADCVKYQERAMKILKENPQPIPVETP